MALAITISVLDGAIANIALPTIARDLQASPASSIWVVNAYQLAIIILLLPLASLGEILGYRRVYWAGHCVFVRRPDDAAPYRHAFAAFLFKGQSSGRSRLMVGNVIEDDDLE